MKRMKEFFAYCKAPGKRFLAWLYAVTAALITASALLAVYVKNHPAATVIYCLAGLALAYSAYTLISACVRAAKRHCADKLKEGSVVRSVIEDYGARTIAFALASLAVNVGYAVVNGVTALQYLSVWYGALAGYYLVLSLLRCGIVLCSRSAAKRAGGDAARYARSKLKIYAGSGLALTVLAAAMAAAVAQMVLSEKPAESGEVMAISTAAYTTYKVTLAAVNFVKAKNYKDPVVQALRSVNVADAALSVLALQVTLIGVFDKGVDMGLMNALTGAGVIAATMCMAIYMAAAGCRRLKTEKEHE